MNRPALLAGLALWVASCGTPEARRDATPGLAAAPVEAVALDGRALRRPVLPDETERAHEARLAEARADYAREPGADQLIWVGRRLGYLGRYRDAIAQFSAGVAAFPRDARFLRHRGHRYLTTRQFALALQDFRAAAALIAGTADQVEPDGLPNARGIPTSTLHTNVYYHLGLTHYLRGENAAALDAWRLCLAASKNPDMEAATRYWLYLVQRRLGLDAEAVATLAAVHADWDILENHAYFGMLLRFRGDAADATPAVADVGQLEDATAAYGLAQWLRLQGRKAEAEALLTRLLDGPQWAAFGYLAAEADRVRAAQ